MLMQNVIVKGMYRVLSLYTGVCVHPAYTHQSGSLCKPNACILVHVIPVKQLDSGGLIKQTFQSDHIKNLYAIFLTYLLHKCTTLQLDSGSCAAVIFIYYSFSKNMVIENYKYYTT